MDTLALDTAKTRTTCPHPSTDCIVVIVNCIRAKYETYHRVFHLGCLKASDLLQIVSRTIIQPSGEADRTALVNRHGVLGQDKSRPMFLHFYCAAAVGLEKTSTLIGDI